MGCLFVFYKATNILYFIKIFSCYLIFLIKKLNIVYFNNISSVILTLNKFIICLNKISVIISFWADFFVNIIITFVINKKFL
ncbi:hypothetical protein DRF60_06845 [Chryseobacterium elymi]|uniref:Uncharacterized protein n=1 Tax=Chryseobacterium elymi TaxID=395936 RepID=A0A3D9DNI3_9FLAO|nr:hypothetical protein DRF60_06845 [Chryseobacterium elymi]